MSDQMCPDHDPNGGPGSDQCMSCGQFYAPELPECRLHGGWQECAKCAVARNMERLTRVWWDYAADAAEKRGLRLVLEQDGPGIVARAVVNLPGGESVFEGWSVNNPDPTEALHGLTLAMQEDGEV